MPAKMPDSAKPRLLLTAKRFRVVEIDSKLPDGNVLTRQIVEHPGAVVILPLLPDARVCLIRNFRPAVGKVLIELPAGTLEANEPPRNTAERELLEETGYQAGKLIELPAFYMSPGILTERMHAFVATELTQFAPNREPGEEIENLVVPWDEAIAMVDQGVIEDAKTIVTLLYCDRFLRDGGIDAHESSG